MNLDISDVIHKRWLDAKCEVARHPNKRMHRNVRANERILQGVELMSEFPIFFCGPNTNEQFQDVCSTCMTIVKGEKLRKCTGCSKQRYCSIECQKASWMKFHKYECKFLKNCPVSNLLFVRTACLLGYGSLSKDDLQCFASLTNALHSHDNFSKKLTEKGELDIPNLCSSIDQSSASLCRVGSRSFQKPNSVTLNDIFYKLSINSFGLFDHIENQCIGSAVYGALSMVNHSCDPNCVFVNFGHRASLRTIKTIEPGEDITICYVPEKDPGARANALRGLYGFDCLCNRCTDHALIQRDFEFTRGLLCEKSGCFGGMVERSTNGEAVDKSSTKNTIDLVCLKCDSEMKIVEDRGLELTLKYGTLKQELSKAELLLDSGDYKESLKLFRNVIEMCRSHFRPFSWTELSARTGATTCAIAICDYQLAVSIGQYPLEGIVRQYCFMDRSIMLHFCSLAKLYSFLQNDWLAVKLLNEIIPILEVCFGPLHPLTKEMVDLKANLMLESCVRGAAEHRV